MLTKTSLVILILSLNSVQSLFYNESEITRIVKNLNHYRGKIDTGNLPKLEWDYDLEQKAAGQTDGCSYVLSIKKALSGGKVDGVGSIFSPILRWYQQSFQYDFKKTNCKTKYRCIEFINMYCNKTKKVGCAYHQCNSEGWHEKKSCKVAIECKDTDAECEKGGCMMKDYWVAMCAFDQSCYQEEVKWPKPFYKPSYIPSPKKVVRRKKRQKKKEKYLKLLLKNGFSEHR